MIRALVLGLACFALASCVAVQQASSGVPVYR